MFLLVASAFGQLYAFPGKSYLFLENTRSHASEDGQFNMRCSLALDSTGNVYIMDTENHLVQEFTSDGKFITNWGSKGSGDGQFLLPFGIDFDSHDNGYVIERPTSRI